MSEETDSDVTEQETPTPISNRRILWLMAAVVVLGGLAGLLFVSTLFGLGFLIGGVLSFVNYFWLKSTLRKIFVETADTGEYKPHYSAARYLTRYTALALVLLVIFLINTKLVAPVILGLASFAFAILIEASIRIFSSFFNEKEI
jgi:hypothetical protein